jgi:hypothetical protein
VAHRENEAVAAQPAVVAWVVSHYLVEKQVSDRREADCGTRMAVTDLFNCIGRQNAGGVYGF